MYVGQFFNAFPYFIHSSWDWGSSEFNRLKACLGNPSNASEANLEILDDRLGSAKFISVQCNCAWMGILIIGASSRISSRLRSLRGILLHEVAVEIWPMRGRGCRRRGGRRVGVTWTASRRRSAASSRRFPGINLFCFARRLRTSANSEGEENSWSSPYTRYPKLAFIKLAVQCTLLFH